MLELKKISKFFPGIKALDNIDFKLKKKSIHALVGENGAGKSTLVKILTGIYSPDKGEILLKGKQTNITNPVKSLKNDISVIHQETVMFENLSVTENIFIGKQFLEKDILINWKDLEQEAKTILNSLESEIDPSEIVKNLSIADHHIIEIARALSQNSKIIIMDEPTAALSKKEVDQLFNVLINLKNRDKSIIFITHKLDEIFKICDEVTILRDGKIAETNYVNNLSKKEIIKKMVGKLMQESSINKKNILYKPILKIKNLSKKNQFKNISFELNEGEILGFYGLVGSGRSEVMKSIFSIINYDSGEIILKNSKCNFKKPSDAIDSGIVYLTEERKDFGIIENMSIRDNLTMTVLNRISSYGILDINKQDLISEDLKNKLNIKFNESNDKIDNLSGGNQQKVVLGKWLTTTPKIIILDEPTKGVDIGSKQTIHKFMEKLVNNGISIIIVSSDLSEIMDVCNRVVVMEKGIIKKIFDTKINNAEDIMESTSYL